MNTTFTYQNEGWRLISLLWIAAIFGWTCFSGLVANHNKSRSQARLELAERFTEQSAPIRAKKTEITQRIDQLPDEKYDDGTPASAEKQRLYNQLWPLNAQESDLWDKRLAAEHTLDSDLWSGMQLVFNRWSWWVYPLLYGGWLVFLLVSRFQAAKVRQFQTKAA